MNLSEKWKLTQQSICLIQHLKNEKVIASGTGFKANGKIITNNHVFQNNGATHTKITFVNNDCVSPTYQKKYAATEFQDLLISGDSKDNWDYAVLKSDSEFDLIPSLMFDFESTIPIGKSVYYLGFPLLKDNLMITSGTIASKFIRNSVKYLQINSNVNNGNSGGPLFDFDSDMIIGIVTRKNTGLSNRFDLLKKSFKTNIEEIKKANQGVQVNFGGMDPFESMKVVQNQFNDLCDEILRSSNVGIGYAFELDQIKMDLEE